MRRLVIWSIVAAAILTGCGGSHSDADSYISSILPARWNHSPITYRVEGGASSIPFANLPASAETGINRWRDAIAPVVLSAAADGETADIIVGFGDRDATGGELGVTTVSVAGDGVTLTGAKVTLLRSLFPSRLDDAAAHEFGHALGVRGHSPDRHDLMYKVVPLGGHLTARDRRTIREIYGLP